MALKKNYTAGDQVTASQLNQMVERIEAGYTRPGGGIPISDLNAAQLEARVKQVGDGRYVRSVNGVPVDPETGDVTVPTGGGGGLIEDPDRPGTFITSGGITENPARPGTFLIGA